MTNDDKLTHMMDVLCPMHVLVSATGHVLHVGPTLQKLRPDMPMVGRRFLEIFDLKRPRAISDMETLRATAGTKLHLKLRDDPKTEVKGILVPGSDEGTSIINLSFGISVVDAVSDYALTNADFAATDLTIEMLYLVEAKSAAMEASRTLNLRLQGAKIAAEEQAFTDTLTGLKNRRAMDHVLDRQAAWGIQFGLMQIDLDWFKAVNDTLGHAAGDHVLQTVARVMVEETRENDTVARVGGDEFVIVLPNAHETSSLRSIGERIISRLSRPVPFQGEMCRISASIGVAIYEPGSDVSVADLMDDADVALYASKHRGRAQQTFYTPDLRASAQNLAPPTGRDESKSA